MQLSEVNAIQLYGTQSPAEHLSNCPTWLRLYYECQNHISSVPAAGCFPSGCVLPAMTLPWAQGQARCCLQCVQGFVLHHSPLFSAAFCFLFPRSCIQHAVTGGERCSGAAALSSSLFPVQSRQKLQTQQRRPQRSAVPGT